MRNPILRTALAGGLVFSLCTNAFALDCWVKAPDLPTLEGIAQRVDGLWQPAVTDAKGVTSPGHIIPQGRLESGGEWAFVHWGKWWKPTSTMTTDSMGNTVPVQANDGLDYSLLRWNFDPAQMPFAAAGGTSATDATTGVLTITAGPVTLTCPPPAGVPVGF